MRASQSFIIPIPNCRRCNRNVIYFAFVATFWHNSIKRPEKIFTQIHSDISFYVKIMEQLITSSLGVRNIRVRINCTVLGCEMHSELRSSACSLQRYGNGFYGNETFSLLFLGYYMSFT